MRQHAPKAFSRHLRVISEVHREVANWLFNHADSPWNTDVTVTRIDLAKDLALASVYYLVREGESPEKAQESLDTYTHAIQRELGANLRLKRTPKVRFVFDRQYAHSAAMERILMDLKSNEPQTDNEAQDSDE